MTNRPYSFALAAALLAVALYSPAEAADDSHMLPGFYGRLDTGGSFSTSANKNFGDNDAGSAGIIGAGLGYRFNENLRTDLTLGYRTGYSAHNSTVVFGNTLSGHADLNSFDALANVYYDIGKYGAFTPYVGGGIGFASNNVDTAQVTYIGNSASINSASETSFAWQLGFGTAVELTDTLALDVGYRYFDGGEFQTGTTVTALGGSATLPHGVQGELHAHEIQAGLRWRF